MLIADHIHLPLSTYLGGLCQLECGFMFRNLVGELSSARLLCAIFFSEQVSFCMENSHFIPEFLDPGKKRQGDSIELRVSQASWGRKGLKRPWQPVGPSDLVRESQLFSR